MGKYIAGPSVLRFPGRPAIVPGEAFEADYETAEQEAIALAAGAITLQPGAITRLEQDARDAEAALAAAIRSAVDAGSDVAADVQTTPIRPAAGRHNAEEKE